MQSYSVSRSCPASHVVSWRNEGQAENSQLKSVRGFAIHTSLMVMLLRSDINNLL